ncbi:required for meiotic nuclear division protein 1 homolog isoform X1 [Macrobrachium rosenbergii]|uniref:required for meiotic nuclear division protein 1 homolog isoform X1 n=1 Tax=Macrobrachium rosenbergii TaxID=79674 RepID=UPI0034D692F3
MLRNILCDVRCMGYRVGHFYQQMERVERTVSNKSYLSHISYDKCQSFKVQLPNICLTEVKRVDDVSQSHETNGIFKKLKDFSSENYMRTVETCVNSQRYLNSTRNIASVWKPVLSSGSLLSSVSQPGFSPSARSMATGRDNFSSIRNRISSLHARKRVPKKKKKSDLDSEEDREMIEGFAPVARHKFLTYDPDFALPEIQAHRPLHRDWQVIAYATADEYDLDGLLEGLTRQGLYSAAAINPGNVSADSPVHAASGKAGKSATQSSSSIHQNVNFIGSSSSQTSSATMPDAHDVLHMVATYQIGSENREIYFFREGSVVFWNVTELECASVLLFLKKYEQGSYKKDDIEEESESLTYTYSDTASKTRLIRNRIVLNPEGATDLEKYTFSNAMAISVKLGIWESSLDKYIDDIEYVSEELGKTGNVVLSQGQVLQCMGQLFALRHLINLSSDLLDTPDFYWEHEHLEHLYQKTSNYLNVSKRTSVMNVKLSHCVELMELLKSHLNEQHSARLEWIIIILIMIEVGFEVLHVAERWL